MFFSQNQDAFNTKKIRMCRPYGGPTWSNSSSQYGVSLFGTVHVCIYIYPLAMTHCSRMLLFYIIHMYIFLYYCGLTKKPKSWKRWFRHPIFFRDMIFFGFQPSQIGDVQDFATITGSPPEMVLSWNRATPNSHPFLDGIFPEINQPLLDIPNLCTPPYETSTINSTILYYLYLFFLYFHTISGWWLGTIFIFPYIGNLIIPIDVHIFQRGGQPPTRSIHGYDTINQ